MGIVAVLGVEAGEEREGLGALSKGAAGSKRFAGDDCDALGGGAVIVGLLLRVQHAASTWAGSRDCHHLQ